MECSRSFAAKWNLYFKEIKAPDGYELSQELYHFTVEKDQTVKGVLRSKMKSTEKDKKGRIQAFYQVKGRNGNFKGLNGKYSGSSVKTGDNSQIGWILLVTCVCLAGAGWCFLIAAEKEKKMVLFLGLVMGAVSLFAFSAMARNRMQVSMMKAFMHPRRSFTKRWKEWIQYRRLPGSR